VAKTIFKLIYHNSNFQPKQKYVMTGVNEKIAQCGIHSACGLQSSIHSVVYTV